MRHPSLLVLLIIAAGCGKKPEPPAPEFAAALAPEPVAAAIPDVPAKRERPKVALTGDPTDPVCAGKKLSEWRAELRTKAIEPTSNPRVHVALRVMQLYGPAAEIAVPDIFAAEMRSADEAAAWLAAIKAIGKPAAAFLMNELAGSREVVPKEDRQTALWWKRSAAHDGLAALGPDAAGVAPQLLAAMDHPDPGVRASAINLLGSIGPTAKIATPALTKALDDPDTDRRLTTAWAIVRVDQGADDISIPTVVKIYLTSKPKNGGVNFTRERARFVLESCGTRSVRHVAALVKKPDGTPDPELLLLLNSLALQHPDPAAVPGLIPLIAKGAELPYVFAALRAFGPVAKEGIPELLKSCRSGPELFRADAMYAAAVVGAAPEDLVPLLAEELKKPQPSRSALDAVDVLGPKAKDLVPALTARLTDPNERTRANVAGALGRVTPLPPEAARVLLELLEGAKDRAAANDAKNALGALPITALAGLRAHLDHPKPSIRLRAAKLVARHDPTDTKAFKLLLEHICREDPEAPPNRQLFPAVVIVDVEALGVLKRAGPAGATRLAELLRSSVREVRGAALYELATMKRADITHIVPVLAERLASADDQMCELLLGVLARVGPAARPYASAIREAAKRRSPTVQFAAARALAALDPQDELLPSIFADLLKPEALSAVRELGFTLRGELAEQYPRGQFVGGSAVALFHSLVSELWFETAPEGAIRGGAFTVPREQNRRE